MNVKSWQVFEFMLAALLIIAMAWLVMPKSAVLIDKRTGAIGIADFTSFYISAKIAVDGNPDKIYDLDLQEKYQSEFTAAKVTKVLPYIYPPYSLAFFAPLVGFSLDDAYHIFQWFNVLCTVGVLALLYIAGICHKPIMLLMAATMIIVSCSWFQSIANGQPNMVVILGLLGGYLLAQHKRFMLAAILLLVTSFKPQMAIIPILYLSIIHGKLLWLNMIFVGLVLLAVCSVIFGLDIWQIYIHSLLTAPYTMHSFEPTHLIMGNIRAILLVILGEPYFALINMASISLWGAGVAAIVIIALSVRNKTIKLQELGFSLGIVIAGVFSPYLWVLSLTTLIIPIVYLLKYSNRLTVYFIAIAILFLNFVSIEHQEYNPFAWVFAQLCLLAWLGHYFRKEYYKQTIKME